MSDKKAMEKIYINMPTGILCSMDRALYNMAIIIQPDATEYSLFTFVNCSTCFGWYITHHQELITLYLQYLSLMRPVVNVLGPEVRNYHST
jgi:hypothetical protein